MNKRRKTRDRPRSLQLEKQMPARSARVRAELGSAAAFNTFASVFLPGRAFAAPARPFAAREDQHPRGQRTDGGKVSAPSSALSQGRISYKFAMRFPSART